MGFVDAVKTVLGKYVVFTGRAGQAEYWYFFLFNILAAIVFSIIGEILGVRLLAFVVNLALLLPGTGVAVRRMHDVDKSGWWLLLCLVPFIGLIIIVWLASQGTKGPNRYGPA
jgi:uncharacterized membrane protein YhaH (DUF805 family)